jgi:hypothetical protein
MFRCLSCLWIGAFIGTFGACASRSAPQSHPASSHRLSTQSSASRSEARPADLNPAPVEDASAGSPEDSVRAPAAALARPKLTVLMTVAEFKGKARIGKVADDIVHAAGGLIACRPRSMGTLLIAVNIDPQGAVQNLQVQSDTTQDPSFSACVVGVVQALVLPASDRGKAIFQVSAADETQIRKSVVGEVRDQE